MGADTNSVRMGELREALMGVRNLEQLAPSLYTSAKVLLSLARDARQSLRDFRSCARALTQELQDLHGRALMEALFEHTSETLSRCDAVLAGLKAPLRARERLELERQIRFFSPRLTAIVEDFEFLLLSYSQPSLPLELRELLSSRSPGSARPARRLGIAGPGLTALVSLPVHVVLRGLSIWLGRSSSSEEAIWAEPCAEGVRLSRREVETPETIAYFSYQLTTPLSQAVLQSGFRCVNIQSSNDGDSLILPLLADSADPR